LALTQITVDVVTTVLLLMSLSLLPQLTPYESSVSRRWRDALIAIGGGLGIAWITWLILTRDHNSISWFFMQQSIPLGGGTNVVNVILVDFRGFDTFGEITVLGIAGIGALCLMDGMRTHGTTMTQGLSYRFNPSPLMLRITRILDFTHCLGGQSVYFPAWTQSSWGWFYRGFDYRFGLDYSIHGTRSGSCRTAAQSQVWSFV
jgi:multisubunit Na+/H+ antiporter MnhB subunit